MSVSSETDVAAARSAEAAAASANNPILLGIPCFVVGGLTLGFFLIGYLGEGGAGPVLTNSIAVAGLGLLIAAIWAIRNRAGAVAGIFGIFAAFWHSFALLLLGIGGAPKSVAAAFALYALVWTIVVAVLTLATLRLPLVYTVLIALVAVALLLVFLFYAGGGTSSGLTTIAGIVAIVFSVLGIYIFYDAMSQALGGRPLPMGAPLIK
jgi:succinate-acetate transporter protein